MQKRLSAVVGGVGLILLGWLGISFTVILPWLGVQVWEIWRFWPLGVIGVGTAFVVTAFLNFGRRDFGGFFIPGTPILMVGLILLAASLLDRWGIWAYAWPLVPLALAIGFVFAALQMRQSELMIPASIIGFNSLALLFCAITGWWSAWAVLWLLEPISVGLGLMIANRDSRSLGLILFAATLIGLFGLGILSVGGWPVGLMISIVLILAGTLWLGWNLLHYFSALRAVT